MRSFVFLSAVLLICNLFSSCESQPAEMLTSSSPDGSLVIEVTGEQESIADPWVLSIVAKKGDRTIGPAFAPLWASVPSTDNVLFDWQSNTRCVISIHNRDGEIQQVPVEVE